MNETNAASFQDVALISHIEFSVQLYNYLRQKKSHMYHIHEQLTLECSDLFILNFL